MAGMMLKRQAKTPAEEMTIWRRKRHFRRFNVLMPGRIRGQICIAIVGSTASWSECQLKKMGMYFF